jgi:hypothetical protein
VRLELNLLRKNLKKPRILRTFCLTNGGSESYIHIIAKNDNYERVKNFVIYRKERGMRNLLLLAFATILAISGPTFGEIIYSGSQNVTLQLQDGDDPPDEMAVISIAGSRDEWDDFMVTLTFNGMMMGSMSHLAIYSPMGMAMSGIVGLSGFAINLNPGEVIGPDSSMIDWGYLTNGDQIVEAGQFGEEGGYLGLMMSTPGSDSFLAWLRVSRQWNIGTSTHGVRIDAWAYEDQPDTPIGAGDIPEPGTFLLCGIGGLVAWLRRRRAL